MAFGGGSFFFTNHPSPASVVPVLALDNGLHIDVTTGKLGGTLIETTEVDTNGFLFSFNPQFASNFTFAIDEPDNLIYIGNYGGPFANKPYLYIDVAGQSVLIGMDTPPTDAKITFHGAAGNIAASAGNDFTATGNNSASMKSSGPSEFIAQGNISSMGDIIGSVNSSVFSVDDSLEKASFYLGINPYFIANAGGQQFVLGDFFGAKKANALYVEIDNPGLNNFVAIRGAEVGNPYFFLIDRTNGVYRIGDISNTLHNSYLSINDTAKTINFNYGGASSMLIDNNALQYQFGPAANNIRLGSFTFSATSGGASIFRAVTTGIQSRNITNTALGPLWVLSNRIAAAVVFDATQYLEVSVAGVMYKIALAN